MLVKAITLKNAVAESDVNNVEDPKTVHSAAPDLQRALLESQEMGAEVSQSDIGMDSTYPIQESTTAFLDLAFRLKKAKRKQNPQGVGREISSTRV